MALEVTNNTDPLEELTRCIESLKRKSEELKNRQLPKDEAPKKGKKIKEVLT